MSTIIPTSIRPNPSEIRVLIVGSGISGLISLAVLKQYGFNVTCVDVNSAVGGQWNVAYDGVLLNNSKDEYCFPGRPYPKEVPEFPCKRDVLNYWNSFVKDLNLDSFIQLNTCVTSMRRLQDKWICIFNKDGCQYQEIYDKVIIATGYCGHKSRRNDKVNLPGREVFPGRIKHISQIEPNWMPKRGSNVTIIGAGASGTGLATIYAQKGDDVRIEHVYRRQHWFAPRRVLGFIPYHELLFARLSSIMISSWYHESGVERFVQSSGMKWFVDLFWRFLEVLFFISCLAPRKGWPEGRLQSSLSTHGFYALPDGYFKYIRQRTIDTHVGTIKELRPNGEVMVSNGDKFRTDEIILATGYEPSIGSFIEDERIKQILNDRRLQFYKHIIHPDVPDVGFIGYAQGFMTCVTEYVQACWVAELFCGYIELPSRQIMLESMERTYDIKEQLIPREPHCGISTSGRHHQYIDELLVSLGVHPRRKSNALTYMFEKTTSRDYANVFEEVQVSRLKRKPLLL